MASKSRYLHLFFFSALVLVLGAAELAHAQATVAGRVSGVVSDSTGAAVVGATLSLRNVQTGAMRQMKSETDGGYNFPLVLPGVYELTCETAGFRTESRPNIQVTTQHTSEVNFALQVGVVTEKMVVEGREEVLQTLDASVNELVDTTQIGTLPNATRYFAHFAELQPGVVQEEAPASKFGGTGVGGFVNGMRLDSNTVTLDGAVMDDPTWPGDGTGDTIHIPLEAVQEMRLVLSDGGPQVGSNLGGQFSMTTRAGSNALHGTAYEYLRNDVFNATDYFATNKPPYKQNIYGFSLGGPLVKNKHFVFGTFERYARNIQVAMSNFRPTPLLLSNIPGGPAYGYLREALDAAYPPALPGYDPTLPLARFVTTQPRILDDYIFVVRTDHEITSRDRLFFRAYYVHSFIDSSGFSKDFPSDTSGFLVSPANYALTAAYTRTLSTSKINEFRASIEYLINKMYGKPTPKALVDLGFNADSTGPGGFPFVILAGTGLPMLGQLSLLPINRHQTVYQFSDTFSMEAGRHSLTLGGDFYRALSNSILGTGLRPTTIFVGFGPPFDTSGSPGLTSGQFLLQQQNFFNVFPERGIRRSDFSLYAGDNWRIHPKVTLNLGLRWDYFGQPSDTHPEFVNNLYQLDASGNPIPDVSITDISRVVLHPVGGEGGFAMYRRNLNNWGPRLGFAYHPFGQFVVRAGFSIFYSKPYFEQFNKNRFNPPFATPTSIFFQPFGSVANPATDGDTPTATAISPGWTTPRATTYNVAIEQGVTSNMVFTARYVGTRGRHLSIIRQPNLGDAPAGPRPNPSFAAIHLTDSVGISNYDAFQTQLRQRLTKGLSFQLNYTFSKALDYRSIAHDEFGVVEISPSNEKNLREDYGRSDFDLTHQLKANFYYELPFGRGKHWGSNWTGVTGHVLGNWAVSGLGAIRSGFPFSIYSPDDLNGDGTYQDRAPIVGDPRSIIINQGFQYLDPKAIGTKILDDPNLPPSGRNIFNGPRVSTWDIAIQKKFTITERVGLEFRSEMLNFMNHPVFEGMTLDEGNNVAATGGSFGRFLRTATNARVVQFSFRLSF